MSFEYLTNIPLEQAKKDYLALLRENGFSPQTETVAVQHAYGRVTSRAVYANINAPHYAASAMDGIALHARDSSVQRRPLPLSSTRISMSSSTPETRCRRAATR